MNMGTFLPNRTHRSTASRSGLTLYGIGHRFGRHQALEDITLDLGTGVFGLLGPNGAGKTTLLKILATVQRPGEGDLRLIGLDPANGHDVRLIRRQLGYLPQAFGYYPNFTVFEFVEYFALLKEMDPDKIRPAVAEAIHRVGLEDRARSRLKSLSGGMIRRVGIAQAIVNSPALLVMDEPTTGLDPEQRVRFRNLIRDIGTRSTVIVSTHLVEDVSAACDRLAVMDRGSFRFTGTPNELVALGASDTGAEEPGESAMERGYRLALGGFKS
ncbi:MAG: ABC transporter ATP-binding protein [Thermomicrobiales bacterium]